MGIGLAGAYGAGAAVDELKDIMFRKRQEQIQRATLMEAIRRANLQHEAQLRGQDVSMRGQDITREGQQAVQSRWDTDRQDRTTAEQAAQEKQANARLVLEQAAPHLVGVLRARDAGLNISDPHAVEAPDVHQAHEDSAFQRKLKETEALETTRGQVRAKFRAAPQSAGTAPAPAASQTQPYMDTRNQRIKDAVAALDKKVSPWTTGAGSLLSAIPATEARNFKAELDTLKSNIAFGELAEMRAASKTGGALGAISDKELALLESARAALDPGQSPANFRAQLKQISDSLARWEAAKSGQDGPSTDTQVDAAARAAELLKKYGGG